MRNARFARLFPVFAAVAAAGCVQVEQPYEHRTSVWVEDAASSARETPDPARYLLWPAGAAALSGPLEQAVSFAGADLGEKASADEKVRPLSVAVTRGPAGPARRLVPASTGWDAFELKADSPAALAFAGLLAREKPWTLGFTDASGGGDRLVLRGCAGGRAWVRASTWPDPHMTLFLDKARALCASLAGE